MMILKKRYFIPVSVAKNKKVNIRSEQASKHMMTISQVTSHDINVVLVVVVALLLLFSPFTFSPIVAVVVVVVSAGKSALKRRAVWLGVAG